MYELDYIKQGLYMQGLPVYDTDLPYIHNILLNVRKAQASLNKFPQLNMEVPITVFDKGLML